MPGPVAHPSARRALLADLVDDAALFPPASRPMDAAVLAHRRARRGPNRDLMGRFICPASRLDELWAGWANEAEPDAPLRLAVVVRPAPGEPWPDAARADLETIGSLARAAGHAARVETVEIPLPQRLVERADGAAIREGADEIVRLAVDSGVPMGATIHLEIPVRTAWPQAVPAAVGALAAAAGGADRAAAGVGLGAKVRCGGADAEAFPTPEQLAAFVGACGRHRLPFKATAGLHHPFRHLDPATGFVLHGFVNLATASVLALRPGVDDVMLAEVLADRRAEDFALTDADLRWRNHVAGADEVAAARRTLFVAYGSCSLDEPVDDLRALGVLPPAGRP